MPDFSKLIGTSFISEDFISLDMSASNSDLDQFDTTKAADWERYLDNFLAQNKAKVAFGGYLELRNLYDRSNHFQAEHPDHKRNIHLGIDLWCSVGTPVKALFDGIVHSFQNNTEYGDYGPTIVLKHQRDAEVFYALYGHLSLASIAEIKKGQRVRAGDIVGDLGSAAVNGNYAPHLHFQIIKDLEGYSGDYPGVCSKVDLQFYQKNCPNPIDYIG